jgi:hypothetical protein
MFLNLLVIGIKLHTLLILTHRNSAGEYYFLIKEFFVEISI